MQLIQIGQTTFYALYLLGYIILLIVLYASHLVPNK